MKISVMIVVCSLLFALPIRSAEAGMGTLVESIKAHIEDHQTRNPRAERGAAPIVASATDARGERLSQPPTIVEGWLQFLLNRPHQ